jgi:glycosyltransferase involved in cell wall biosynthesis
MMRIVVDLQGAQTGSRFRGIGRYSTSLTRAIARNAGAHEIWLALNANFPEAIDTVRESFGDLIPQDRIRVFDVPYSLRLDTWEKSASEILREAFLDHIGADVVLVSSLFEGFQDAAVTSVKSIETRHRTAAIVYDLIPHVFKDRHLQGEEFRRYYYGKWDWLRRTDALLAISEATRAECIEYLGCPPERITTISSAVESDFGKSQLDSHSRHRLLERLGINRKVVLYVPGGFDQRKNFERLIEAFAKLDENIRRQYQLVITSRIVKPIWTGLTRFQKRQGLRAGDVVFTDYLVDDELASLYGYADLFVFPSLQEGFGLPLLEAMTCGAPVIGSNCSSVPEVIANPDALFDPRSVTSIKNRMQEALEDGAFRQRLRQHSRSRSADFSWDRCAQLAIGRLESLLQESPKAERPTLNRQTVLAALARAQGTPPKKKDRLRVARSMAFNHGLPGARQLLMDVSTIVVFDAKSGIQRVVRSLLSELLKSSPPGLVIRAVYFKDGKYRYANRFIRQMMPSWPTDQDSPVDFFQDDIYLSLDLNMHLPETFGLHEEMRRMGIKVAFIVYDLLLAKRPDWWPANIGEFFLAWLDHIRRTADQLLCISESVAEETRQWIVDHSGFRPGGLPQVASFKLGADIANSVPTRGMPPDAGEVLSTISARPSFLMVGTIEPRKGHALALSAFDKLWAEDIDVNLVVVGKAGWLVDELVDKLNSHPERDSRLFWLQGISDEYLEAVYAASTCLLAASEGEGFGLPLIEAATHRLPIIARDLPIHREVAGNAAYYFKRTDALGLSEEIRTWLALFDAGDHPDSSEVSSETWAESAHSLLQQLSERSCLECPTPLGQG